MGDRAELVVDDRVAQARLAGGGRVHVEPWAGWTQWRLPRARPRSDDAVPERGDAVWCAGLVRAQLVVAGQYLQDLPERIGPAGYRCSMPETVRELWLDAPLEEGRTRLVLSSSQIAVMDRVLGAVLAVTDTTDRILLLGTMRRWPSDRIAAALRQCRSDDVCRLAPRTVRKRQLQVLDRVARAWARAGFEPCGASLKLWQEWQNRDS